VFGAKKRELYLTALLVMNDHLAQFIIRIQHFAGGDQAIACQFHVV
jgi:hypothetical protein